jgi:hypothetical protein
MKKEYNSFYVINFDANRADFVKYDVMPYFIKCYKEIKKKEERPVTFKQFKEFIERKSSYMYRSRCEYEIVLVDFPCNRSKKKIDVHWQIMNNIDVVTNVLMLNVL